MLLAILVLVACAGSDPVAAPGAPDGEDTPPPASFVAVPFVSAHRGGAAYAPENTMLAYRNAARLGVDDFETDMLLTADGVAVLIHDDTLDRTTDCSGNVADKTYAEILGCDAAYWWSPGQATTSPDAARAHPLRGRGVTVPTAAELFAFAAGFQGAYAPTVTIEIKIAPADPLGATAAAALVELIHASGIADRIIVQSFNPLAIDSVKRLDASIKTLYLTPSGAYLSLAYAIAGGHDYVAPSFDSPDLDAAFVTAAHAAGKLVEPWTADREADIRTLIELGVDGIITNYPGCLLAMQERLHTARLAPAEAGAVELEPCR
ncbi:glycerophosphodiester phosphodiesterase family protein [Fontimonas sp. SYSU GA230001]|uniref:glycerophosphodiester phosphodiesterase n=1 Tax=Fontimonas sp. SYSU GA230001 TaxID=3142450 RepID=UPI0032B35AA9